MQPCDKLSFENFYYPIDFIILDIEPTLHPSANIPIILGKPFLATANTLINYRNGRIKITFGSMIVELNIFNVNPHNWWMKSVNMRTSMRQHLKKSLIIIVILTLLKPFPLILLLLLS
jgi:hypothetical protein